MKMKMLILMVMLFSPVCFGITAKQASDLALKQKDKLDRADYKTCSAKLKHNIETSIHMGLQYSLVKDCREWSLQKLSSEYKKLGYKILIDRSLDDSHNILHVSWETEKESV